MKTRPVAGPQDWFHCGKPLKQRNLKCAESGRSKGFFFGCQEHGCKYNISPGTGRVGGEE